jgi:hypothetical protein
VEAVAANVHELSGSWVLLEVATISQILVGRSNDERKRRDHEQAAHAINYTPGDRTAPPTHRSSSFGSRILLLMLGETASRAASLSSDRKNGAAL